MGLKGVMIVRLVKEHIHRHRERRRVGEREGRDVGTEREGGDSGII